MCVPAPAVAGLNVPVLDVPGPDHVPPVLSALSGKGGSVEQTGATAVITGLTPLPGVTCTTTVIVTGATQGVIGVPVTVYVVVEDGKAVTVAPVVGLKPVVGDQVQL